MNATECSHHKYGYLDALTWCKHAGQLLGEQEFLSQQETLALLLPSTRTLSLFLGH